MAKKKAHKPGVFSALNQALAARGPFQRQVLLDALHEDVPQLGSLIAEQSAGLAPVQEYRTYITNRERLSTGERLHAAIHPALANQLTTLLPRHLDKRHPMQQVFRGHNRRSATCEALVLDEQVLDTALAGGQGKEVASYLLADLAGKLEAGPTLFLNEAVEARIRKLLDHASNERTAFHFARGEQAIEQWHSTPWERAPGFPSETFERMATLWKDVLMPASHEHAKELVAAQLTTKTHDQQDLPLPKPSMFGSVNEARLTLVEQLETVHKPSMGAWLNRPQVWAAVRNTGAQEEFVRASVNAGGLRAVEPSEGEAEIVPVKHEHPLLAGLEDQSAATQQAKRSEADDAREALVGYINSISSKTELAGMYTTLALLSLNNNYRLSAPVPILDALRAKAAAYPFSAKEACDVFSQATTQRGTSSYADLVELIETMEPKLWTAQEIEALWQRTPVIQHPRSALVATLCSIGAQGIDALSDSTIHKCARMWPEAGFWGTMDAPQMFEMVQKIVDRVPQLPVAMQADIVAYYMRIAEHDTGGTGLAIARKTVEAQLGSPGNATLLAHLAPYTQGQPELERQVIMASPITPDLPGATQRLADKCIDAGGHDISRHVLTLARLFGYDSQNDKAVALAGLDSGRRVKLLALLAERELSGRSSVAPALLQNLAFDLVEGLPALPTVKLTGQDKIVRAGYANAGEHLSFEGASVFLAPYLDGPRPPLTPATGSNPAKPTPEPAKEPLGKDDIRTRMRQVQTPDEEDGFLGGPMHRTMMDHGPRFMGRMPPEMMMMLQGMPMHPAMLAEMMDDFPMGRCMGPRGAFSNIDRLPPQIRQRVVANDIIKKITTQDWFAPVEQPTSQPKGP